MAYTQADYDELQAAIARGAKSVAYRDKRVEYRSLDEMRSILAEMGKQLAIPSSRPPSRTYAKFDKGLG